MSSTLKDIRLAETYEEKRFLDFAYNSSSALNKFDESVTFSDFINTSDLGYGVRDTALAILYDSQTVTMRFDDQLESLSSQVEGLFYRVSTLIHRVSLTQWKTAHMFEVKYRPQRSVFLASVSDIVMFIRKVNINYGLTLLFEEVEAREIVTSDQFAYVANKALSNALTDPVVGPQPLTVIHKSGNHRVGPTSGDKGVYSAVSRHPEYRPCYYKVANSRGVVILSVLNKRKSGLRKWLRIGTMLGDDAFPKFTLDKVKYSDYRYHQAMLNSEMTTYTYNKRVPPLREINAHISDRVSVSIAKRYAPL